MSEIKIKTTGGRETSQSSDGRLSIRVPIQIGRRSGRKLIKSPAGEVISKPWDKEPTVFQLSLARGHRWARMFESGEVISLKEIAEREGVDKSYVSRLINLTTLAPSIIEAILDDTLPGDLTILELAVNPPAVWKEQCEKFSD